MKNYLFPTPPVSKAYSFFLLALRIAFGLLIIRHGIEKFANYTDLCFTFPDPLGFGKDFALIMVIFAELCCGLAFMLGVLYRLCMIPLIIVMGTAFFHVHEGSISSGELAFCYLLLFVLMYITGPGKYSIDAIISSYLNKDDDDDEF